MNIAAVNDIVLETAQTYMSDWNLEQRGPAATTEDCLLLPVTWQKTPATLKVYAPESDRAAEEAAFLQINKGGGCLRLYQNDIENGTLLIEDIDHTLLRELVTNGQDDYAFSRICSVARILRQNPVPDTPEILSIKPFSTLVDKLDQLKSTSDIYALRVYFGQAANHARELADSYPRTSLLHGDLHYNNVLYHWPHRC